MISEETLHHYGAEIKTFEKGDFIFYQDGVAKNYFQVKSGEVKMNNYNEEGKEFIQGIFKEGRSFGEPPLFIGRVYPANAEAMETSEVLQLPKAKFFEMLKAEGLYLEVLETFAKRLYYKATVAAEISYEHPEHRILTLLNYFKKYSGNTESAENYKVDFTRKEIAHLTGLRVETVIRAIKSLESQGKLKIISGKVWMPI
ncbi:MAG: Crp/Fnr family transcriptional regulator [Bacteroidota bacterium]